MWPPFLQASVLFTIDLPAFAFVLSLATPALCGLDYDDGCARSVPRDLQPTLMDPATSKVFAFTESTPKSKARTHTLSPMACPGNVISCSFAFRFKFIE
eukprot:3629929-Rhodomonas_salina.1